MDRFLPYYFLLTITITISLTFANPLPQWELSRADDMPSGGIQTIEFLTDFATQNDNINLVDRYTDLRNHISNNLMGGGINSPFLVADKGFRVYSDPNDPKRPVLEIETTPTKIPPPNTPVGLCANTNPIGLCYDDHKDTTQPLRVACQPFDDGRSAACTKTNANIACCKRYILMNWYHQPESLVRDSYQSSTLIAMEWTTGGVGAGCQGSEKYSETNVPTNVGAPEPYPALQPNN